MILVMHNLRKRKSKGLRTFVTSLMLTAFCMPSPATAVTLGQLKGNSGFRTMVVAISNLNVAMQQATINPHDKVRRENVAKAYSMMPLAVTALAKEFKNNKLHDQDFQFVQGILGGFVQKDLTSKVEEFMKNPSNQNIPSVGQGFPQEALKDAENSYIVASQEKSLLATENEDGTPKELKSKGSSDLVDLNTKFNPAQSAEVVKDSKSIPEANSTIVADSNKSLLNSPDTEIKDDKKSLDSNAAVSKRDEAQSQELAPASSAVRKPASQNDEEEALDKGFFKDKKPAGKEAKEKKIRKGASQGQKSGFLFNSKRKQLVSYIWDSLFPVAAAEQLAPNPPCQGGGKECGGGGGGGGGSGGGAAEILFGLAAIMAAASPMVAAAIQANADKQIAQINSNTAITNANTQASLQRYSIDQQTGLAKFQAEATQQIAQEKNQKEMAQLQMQLADLAQARQQQADLEREKRANEQANMMQELALKEQQAAQTIQLAQQQRMAQEVAQGLSTGLQTVRDANGRLTVSNVPLTGGVGLGANGSLASGAINLAGRNSSFGLNGSTGSATASAATNSVAQANAAAATSLGSAFTAPKGSVASNSVITANKTSSPNTNTAKALLASAVQPVIASGSPMVRGLASVSIPVKASQRGLAPIAQGSSRGAKQKLPNAEVPSPEVVKTELAFLDHNIPENVTRDVGADSAHTVGSKSKAVNYYSRGVRRGAIGYGY